MMRSPIVLLCAVVWVSVSLCPMAQGQSDSPCKNQIAFPDDAFQSWTSPPYIKFTIITKEGYDPNVVYYQDCTQYDYHYDFALKCLEPFVGMTIEEFDAVTLHAAGQQAILGAVILPPWHDPAFNEYGIQLTRTDAHTREETLAIFNLVKASVIADANVTAYYFPTYEQYSVAQVNREWFETRGIPIGSTAQWSEGGAIYSPGWTLGTLKQVTGSDIQRAYTASELTPDDVLLTDGVPAEIPSVAGIITLMASTPNSHVAILSRSQGVPFVYLVDDDAALAQSLVGHSVYLAATQARYDETVKVLDAAALSEDEKSALLAMKKSAPLVIQPMTSRGDLWADTSDLSPSDIRFFGGKASNYGVLRRALPNDVPRAMAFSFDLWSAFLDQSIAPVPPLVIAAGGHLLLWADSDPAQGACHLGFRLSNSGEAIGLFDSDGATFLDSVTFGSQDHDISYGRSTDGGPQWQFFENPTPGRANDANAGHAAGLVINEFMAWNKATIQDPDESGEFSDWIELYNGSDDPVILSGMFLTDDLNEPTKWQVPVATTGPTLRDEIVSRLAKYTTYPPADLKALAADLLAIRGLFTDTRVTGFSSGSESTVIDALNAFGFDPNQPIRFRSSTNVEDSAQFTGAGLYESHSGRLPYEHTIFDAIRNVFASFYNDNAFLERLKHDVNEAEVGMALLVHHSFPDEIELANGVATLERDYNERWSASIVSQKGAVSVTNPPTDAVPEEVRIEVWGSDPYVEVRQRSSLVSLRENTVLEWESEYVELYNLLVTAADRYCKETGKQDIVLDFEFKKTAPDDKLVVKQIREIPQAGNAEYETPFLLGQAKTYWTLQGRGGNVFTNHRLKSRWTLAPRSVWLDDRNLEQGLYDQVTIEYAADGEIRQVAGSLSSLPDASHVYTPAQSEWDSPVLTDSWRFADQSNPRTYRLQTMAMFDAVVPDPVVTIGDFRIDMEVAYDQPVPVDLNDVTTDEAASLMLYQPWEPTADDEILECSLDDPNTGVSICTRFYMRWSWNWTSPTSVQFESTRIEGLTTEPILLTGYFSQSIGGGAHLCPKNFLFEPGLEPGISQQTLDELIAKNVRLIYYTTGARECRPTERKDTPPFIGFYGFDEPIE
ncbi:MAG: hypothetical protein KBE65_04040 [Phycisphaerae bacterium]|nr:hypothetical protein [Phycisphaerae bacterium]